LSEVSSGNWWWLVMVVIHVELCHAFDRKKMALSTNKSVDVVDFSRLGSKLNWTHQSLSLT